MLGLVPIGVFGGLLVDLLRGDGFCVSAQSSW